jgi:hypothetical protein
MGDRQATKHEKAQTHHEAKSESHECDEAQQPPFDACMTSKWKKKNKDQRCQANQREVAHDK